jgi:AcrR family transcriptional regulator
VVVAGNLQAVGRAERNKRQRIIAAARELFRTKGFEQTTTGEIAELADVGKGTLFFHDRSKDELLVMVFQEEIGKTIERAFCNRSQGGAVPRSGHAHSGRDAATESA